eukprot:TRINITY_DN198_c1_g2_i1.p1 TRINITY_DN198_c1_g2~~TRINITY_DN198_c1_g2_i1.p1  ORF type:complete len:140 (-),score=9.28 TRINITY_DN198_c1_g2_i1:146-565(-)
MSKEILEGPGMWEAILQRKQLPRANYYQPTATTPSMWLHMACFAFRQQRDEKKQDIAGQGRMSENQITQLKEATKTFNSSSIVEQLEALGCQFIFNVKIGENEYELAVKPTDVVDRVFGGASEVWNHGFFQKQCTSRSK